jgi:hypothetical protein
MISTLYSMSDNINYVNFLDFSINNGFQRRTSRMQLSPRFGMVSFFE